MRLAVVHDRAGRILAAAEISGEGPIARPSPVDPTHTALEVDVPAEHEQVADLYELAHQLRVDPARQLLVPREAD